MTTSPITNTGRRGGDTPRMVNWNEGPRCPICRQEFDSEAQVDAHMAVAHPGQMDAQLSTGQDAPTLEGDWDYVCACGARFASATAYALHARNCPSANGGDLIWVTIGNLELALFPWEDVASVVAEAEAILSEKDAKPDYGLEVDVLPWEVATEADETSAWLASDEPDELALMAADLDALRLGLVKPLAYLDTETLEAIEDEPVGVEFCTRPYLF